MVDTVSPSVADVLLAENDPPAVTVRNHHGSGPVLFTCDHACNRIPASLGDLGLTEEQLLSHIAWDPGALPVAQHLAARFDSPLIYGGYSRLVVDLNRPPDSPDSMPVSSAGIPIPGNLGLSDTKRWARLQALFRPYHAAIESVLDARAQAGLATVLVAIHSFTPHYPGETRPWQVGVIHRHDFGFGAALVDALRAENDILVGDNRPFQIQDDGDATIPVHGERRSLPNALIELRQDGLANSSGREIWASRLAAALERALGPRLGESDRMGRI